MRLTLNKLLMEYANVFIDEDLGKITPVKAMSPATVPRLQWPENVICFKASHGTRTDLKRLVFWYKGTTVRQ